LFPSISALPNISSGEKRLADAPFSVLTREFLPDVVGIDMNYKPKMADVAPLPLPQSLPLDFVAGM